MEIYKFLTESARTSEKIALNCYFLLNVEHGNYIQGSIMQQNSYQQQQQEFKNEFSSLLRVSNSKIKTLK
jgi:hypothetical protein